MPLSSPWLSSQPLPNPHTTRNQHSGRYATSLVAACTIAALCAGTASATPASTSATFTAGMQGAAAGMSYPGAPTPDIPLPVDIDQEDIGRIGQPPRQTYTGAPVFLADPAAGMVMLAGKDTRPASHNISRRTPGFNPWEKPAPRSEGPNDKDIKAHGGFSEAQLYTLYKSDIPEGFSYIAMLRGVDTAMAIPSIKKANVEAVFTANNNASIVQIQRAVADSEDENLATFADAMGSHLGSIYFTLYTSGKLPKLHQLVGKSISRTLHLTNNTALEKAWYHHERPFNLAPTRIKYYYEDEEDMKEDEGYAGLLWSYPSGHTNRAFMKGIVLAAILPELGTQLLARTSEVGYNRLVMGVHYPLDVMAGRMTASANMAEHFADDGYYALFREAQREVRGALEAACGMSIAKCAAQGTPWLGRAESVRVYDSRMYYGFPRIGKAGQKLAMPAHAAALLRTAFPQLTVKQREQILIATAIDSGYPLDVGGREGAWQRINLAKAFAATVTVRSDGSLLITLP